MRSILGIEVHRECSNPVGLGKDPTVYSRQCCVASVEHGSVDFVSHV